LYRLEQFQRNQFFGGGPAVMGNHLGWVKLLGEELIVYQVGERITAADALTGKPRWVRDSVRRQSRIFGDRERLAVIPPDSTSVVVLKTADGEILRTRPLPIPHSQVAFHGINVIAWTTPKGQKSLESRDLETGKLRWTILCPEVKSFLKVGEEELALFELDGQFRIVSLKDGATKVDAKVESVKDRLSHEVRRVGNVYLLLSSKDNPPARAGRNPFVRDPIAIPVDGLVYAFDAKTGKFIWKTEIADQALEKLPPYHSPVIVFSKRRMPAQGGGFDDGTFRVEIRDLRTGELVFDHNRLQNVSPWGIRVEPAGKKLTVTFYKGEIEIKPAKETLKSTGT
jgi:outer membrane protein assembly factor BamB